MAIWNLHCLTIRRIFRKTNKKNPQSWIMKVADHAKNLLEDSFKNRSTTYGHYSTNWNHSTESMLAPHEIMISFRKENKLHKWQFVSPKKESVWVHQTKNFERCTIEWNQISAFAFGLTVSVGICGKNWSFFCLPYNTYLNKSTKHRFVDEYTIQLKAPNIQCLNSRKIHTHKLHLIIVFIEFLQIVKIICTRSK